MKIGILTNAFLEERFIQGCVEQFKNFDVKHLVLIPYKAWNGPYVSGFDNTGVLAIDSGASVIYGDWKSTSDQLNYGLTQFKDYDWVIICDADERYTQYGLQRFFDFFPYIEADVIKTNDWIVYWKTADYELLPHQTDYPTIAVKPHVKFVNIRDTGLDYNYIDVPMYHFSYYRTDEEMLKKISAFEASKQFNIQKWYENIWLKWTPEMENLHPVNPNQFKKAIYNPPPQEIKELLP